jgi:RNA polymerase sigma-70 factor (ECF subfamily)
MALIDSPPGSGFEQYAGEIYGWAYRVLGRHHDALDVVQEVFLRWDAQCTRQTPQRPRGWLRRVTLNRAIDLRRKRQTAQEADTSVESVQVAAASWPQPGQRIDHDTLREDITAALDRLSEVQRGVLVAKVYDEMTFAEIAGELDLAPSTVKTHYLRAVRAVRDRLQRRWGEEELP